MTPMTQAAQDVLAERARQVSAEGWTPQHDDQHDDGSLAMAAACYAAPMAKKGKTEQVDVSGGRGECPVWRSKWFSVPFLWPDSWHAEWWKPGREADLSVDGLGPVSRAPDRRRDLVRAAALLLAEIERLDRASGVGVTVTVPINRPATLEEAEHAARIGACLPNGVMFDAFGRERVRYVRVIHDGTTCVVSPGDVADLVDPGRPDDYRIEDVYLSKEEFDALPEFDGF